MLRYKLRTATVVVCHGDGHPVAMTVPCGAILNVPDESVNSIGQVEVVWNGSSVRMFAEDLHSRGTLINARSA